MLPLPSITEAGPTVAASFSWQAACIGFSSVAYSV